MDNFEFKINKEQGQFEFGDNSNLAVIEFIRQEDKLFFLHTEVPANLRGQGVAGKLVTQALQYARDNEYKVVPSCSYVANYVNEHPEWNEVLSEGYRM